MILMNDIILANLKKLFEALDEHFKIALSNVVTVTSRKEIVSNEKA
jgi:hypothetical protein